MLNRVKFPPSQNKEGVVAFVFIKPPSEDLFFVVKQQKGNTTSNIVIESPPALFDWSNSADFVEALMVARSIAMTKDMNNRFQFHTSLENAIRGGYFMNPTYQVYHDYVDSNNMIYYYRIQIDYAVMGNPLGVPASPADHFSATGGHSYTQPFSHTTNPNANMGAYQFNNQFSPPVAPQIRQVPIVVQDAFTMQEEKLLVDITLPVVLRSA